MSFQRSFASQDYSLYAILEDASFYYYRRHRYYRYLRGLRTYYYYCPIITIRPESWYHPPKCIAKVFEKSIKEMIVSG